MSAHILNPTRVERIRINCCCREVRRQPVSARVGSRVAGHCGFERQLVGTLLNGVQIAENNTAKRGTLHRTDFPGPHLKSV